MKTINVRIDETTYKRLMEEAERRFPKPNGNGNMSLLLRHIINDWVKVN